MELLLCSFSCAFAEKRLSEANFQAWSSAWLVAPPTVSAHLRPEV